MAIPKNITKEHLLQAISKIDYDGIPKDGDSQYYDVHYKGKKYPPKLIVSFANLFANGITLDRNSFSGGLETQCFKLLEENNFEIIKKSNQMEYYDELKKFISQAKSNELGTGNYLNNYQGLSVKVSFGKGNQARVPWIAFLNETDNVQQGIYPVFLFYKEKQILILAFGVSETHKPDRKWKLNNEHTIEQYFADNDLGKPERYGSSFIFKSYDTSKDLDSKKINNDLNKLIAIYKSTNRESKPNLNPANKFQYMSFNQATSSAGLFFNDKINIRFVASLLTKPFVILTGLSGSGKTKLAQAFAMWICENEDQYCIVPVGADWTNREPLLGFPNALKIGEYLKPDNGVLDIIIDANSNQSKPYFLILDEMNLSHVERYFADFLSVMESSKEISLHSGKADYLSGETKVPSQINLPKNLFIIGTVNIDETTYMFSPKVLDRANVIEFKVTEDEMKNFLNSNIKIELNNLKSVGLDMAESFLEIAKDKELQMKNSVEMQTALLLFFSELKKVGAEFGYRSAAEINRFAAVVDVIEPNWTMIEIIDAAIMQKLLPKVHGSRRKLAPILETLGSLCLTNKMKEGEKIENHLNPKEEKDISSQIKYPLSFEKISRMYKGLLDNGFTSYAEA